MLFLVLALAAQAPDTATTLPWQQHVAYDITARLDEPRGVLGGTETVVYENHSPDTLTTISFHLYLNAFRPGSRWSDADSTEGRRRFNDLKDPDFGFNHVSGVTVDGQSVAPIYPFAPDSTIVRFVLPRPLPPGGHLTVAMQWDARPSTTPRRQGRQGRRFDFAEWYPRVVTYDRYGWEEHALYPAGEFYGEFGSFIVRLDVPQDQVVGSTGVPVCGDPGWDKANRGPTPIEYQRDYYGNAAQFATACDGADPGRKRIVWYADKVHHFAMSLNPEYRYEGGHFGAVAIHVLYQPGDSTSWGGGVAVQRTATALAWLDQTFGKFGWPQITNVHRIEGGGTEFPMMIHNGSASQGLIVHELGHNYVMGLLANNEWKEGWLDEGFTSFQTSWFWETVSHADAYPGTERFILGLDLDGQSEPPDLPGEDYRDFTSYNLAIYVRGELFFHQLRYIVGDSTMRAILHAFYARYQYHHVDEDAFKRVAEEVSHRDLNAFFAQWLHTTELYDYALGRVRHQRLPDGSWRTRAEVVRKAPGMIPVEVAFIAGKDTTVVRTDGFATSAWVEAVTSAKPEVVVDPRERTHDWNLLNNTARPRTDRYLDTYFSEQSPRDALGLGIAPVAWFNDAGGLTVGARTRENYLGRYELNLGMLSYSTGAGHDAATGPVRRLDFAFRWKNPVGLRAPGSSQTFDLLSAEGRDAASVNFEHTRQDHLSYGPVIVDGLSFRWLHARDLRFLDPSRWELGGTFEAGLSHQVSDVSTNGWRTMLGVNAVAGAGYTRPGATTTAGTPYDWAAYGRVSVTGTATRRMGALALSLRGFVGATIARDSMPREALFFVGGAGPAAELWNPFLRSRGALLVRPDVYYQQPGDGNVRGLSRAIAANHLATFGVELARTVASRPKRHLFNSISVAAFGDAGVADGDLAAGSGAEFKGVAEAGVG
ncbi:MAG TPA: M1 family metallopeptidase, partial [Gemmatimonadales bacterium]|nr:M1 family metallopeptidase [Gemmatimonadales bacterium]